MYSRPWLAVAVYARAPVAEAPIATDIAANSDSTLTNSHGASSPVFTSCERFSTMCVCGRDRVRADHLGAAQRDGLGDRTRALKLPTHALSSRISP